MFNSFDAFRDRRRNRQAYRQLVDLNDQMLADIGLTRHDLEQLRRGRGVNSDRSSGR